MNHLFLLVSDIKHPKPKLPPEPFFAPEVEIDSQSLRDGTGRYTTAREDGVFFGICAIILVAEIAGIWLLCHFLHAKGIL